MRHYTSQKVQSELPRDAIGFLTRAGVFVSTHPWLILDNCPVCKRPEIFVFNRFEHNLPTYIAMETGHPHEHALLAGNVATEIQAVESK